MRCPPRLRGPLRELAPGPDGLAVLDGLLLLLAEAPPGLEPRPADDVDPQQHDLVHRVLVVELDIAVTSLLSAVWPNLLTFPVIAGLSMLLASSLTFWSMLVTVPYWLKYCSRSLSVMSSVRPECPTALSP
jgi:hypothetical protein